MHSRMYLIRLTGLLLLLLVILMLSLIAGSVRFSPGEVLNALFSRVPVLKKGVDVSSTTEIIVWDFRFARSLLASVVGAALAASGAAFQGLFRNPLADPFIIGASSGAALGATLAIALNLTVSFAGFSAIPAAAFAGSILSVLLVYSLSTAGTGGPPTVSLLLAGTALSSLFGAVVSLIMVVKDKELHQIFFWLLGGFGGSSWSHLLSVLPYVLPGGFVLVVLARPLDILAFGEESAQGMGLDVSKIRLVVVVSASLTTAAAVAVSGIIGFVGLLAPHMARLMFGPTHRILLPASALTGAILLVLADDCARMLLSPVEIPVGILTAILGAPFFLYLLRSRQGNLGGSYQ